jgi:aminopeptidase N
MPGTNLTREEAATRAALLDVTSYSIDLDLTTGDKTFASTTTLRFTCREPGAETFVDLVGAIIHEITLNGEPVDEASAYQDSRIRLIGLEAENELVVRADCAYSHSVRACTGSWTRSTVACTSTRSSRSPTPGGCSRRSSSPT